MNLKSVVVQLFQNEAGQDVIEYALVAALLALSAVATLNNLASQITAAYLTIAAGFNSAI